MGVLDGIRVLDYGRFIAAPWCSALLADMGADVVRVEKREGGEDRWVQSVADQHGWPHAIVAYVDMTSDDVRRILVGIKEQAIVYADLTNILTKQDDTWEHHLPPR